MLIEQLIHYMEKYFLTSQITIDKMFRMMVQKVVPKHFDDIRPYIQYEYLQFRDLFEVFREPDTINAKLQELSRVVQYGDETIAEYMHRVLMVVI